MVTLININRTRLFKLTPFIKKELKISAITWGLKSKELLDNGLIRYVFVMHENGITSTPRTMISKNHNIIEVGEQFISEMTWARI